MKSNSPPPQKLIFRDFDWQVEDNVDTIAAACGLSPELTGVIMAAIIGGLNRRKPENVPSILDGVPTGPNILVIGAEQNPRVRRLLSILLGPLTSKQNTLRDATSSCHSDTLALLQFGPEGKENLNDPTRDVLDRIKQGPFRDDLLGLKNFGSGRPNGRELITVNHPSICLANPEPDTLLAGLDEALDGQLLVFDDHGDLFQMLAAPSRGDRGKSDKINSFLGQQGSDDIIRNQHPRSGPGSLETRQLNMVSMMSRQQMIALMEHKGSRLRLLLEQFLVIDVTASSPAPADIPSFKELSSALRCWMNTVSFVYTARIFGREIGPTPPENIADHLMLVTADFHGMLEEKANECPIATGNLWGLPFQFYLALAIVSGTGNNGLAPILTSLDRFCEWAVENHATTLGRLEDEATGNELMQRREAILRAIGRRGPCTFRIMVRTFSVQRKDLYEPLVNELIDEGEIIEMEDGLLALPSGDKNRLQSRERCLN